MESSTKGKGQDMPTFDGGKYKSSISTDGTKTDYYRNGKVVTTNKNGQSLTTYPNRTKATKTNKGYSLTSTTQPINASKSTSSKGYKLEKTTRTPLNSSSTNSKSYMDTIKDVAKGTGNFFKKGMQGIGSLALTMGASLTDPNWDGYRVKTNWEKNDELKANGGPIKTTAISPKRNQLVKQTLHLKRALVVLTIGLITRQWVVINEM